jgi:hypothetical protein
VEWQLYWMQAPAWFPLWDELVPAEQARIVQLLVERIDVGSDSITVRIRTEGLASLASDLRRRDGTRVAA